jgi:hypothetical protein
MKKYALLVLALIVIAGALAVMLSSPAPDNDPLPIVEESAIQYENASEDDLVLQAPTEGSIVESPVSLTGEARGTWYFEAIAGVKITDANAAVLGEGIVTAQSDWMTTDFVSFDGAVSFTPPATPTGFIVFEKENPSGLPANDASISIPITF